MTKKLFTVALCCTLFIALKSQISAESAAANYPFIKNERFVVSALRTISSAQATYAATAGNGNYGTFSDLRQAGFIDSVLASGSKYGYRFSMRKIDGVPNHSAEFKVTATPRHYRKTGRTSFYIDETGTMRGTDKNGDDANANDQIFENECLANEKCTIANMRWLHSAEVTYQVTSGNGNFGTLAQLRAANLVNELLARGYVSGYNFTIIFTAPTSNNLATLKILAAPTTYGVTGFRSFYIDETGVIRGADKHGEPATANDPVIEQ